MWFRFSPKVTGTCVILALLMVRASYWQYQRHQQKLVYIQTLGERLHEPVAPLTTVIGEVPNEDASPSEWQFAIHRRVSVEGIYDFEHEMVLRNRRLDGIPGVYLITPLKIKDSPWSILVSRGFVPLSYATKEKRAQFDTQSAAEFTGLVKESMRQKIFAPSDPPTGGKNPWVDAWLRVNTEEIAKQLPYKILPIYLEIMQTPSAEGVEEKIVNSKSDREQMLVMPGSAKIYSDRDIKLEEYPKPVFSTVVDPGRHKGYIFEWAAMALITLLIGLVLQLRRPEGNSSNKSS